MKILITGANGQLGQDFQKLFRENKIDFIATDYMTVNNCLELDITNKNSVREFLKNEKINLIINCAAYNNVDGAESDANNAMKLNCDAPKILAEMAKEIGADFVTYSTDFVFSGSKGSYYTEEDATEPISKYGISKAEGEKAVLDIYDNSFVIRTSWVFGLGNDNFVKKVLRWAEGKNTLKVVDDEISSPTYSWDLALLSWKLIETKKYGLYNLTNNGIASRNDFAKYILNKSGWRGVVETAKQADFNLPAKRPYNSKLSTDKIEKLLGERIPEWQDAVDRFLEELNNKISL